jgi:uncharacterized phage protein (TIGR01671 family)
MNREIKFRVWDSTNKCFIPSPYWYLDPVGPGRWQSDHTEMANCHIQQYTGLKDKNGKEIYEGDYVKFLNHKTNEIKIAEVFWYDDEAGFFVGSQSKMIRPIEFSSIIEDTEVIGNIYENPELLNK